MPRSPRSTRPRAGRLGRSRPAGLPAAAPGESSSRLLFTSRLVPVDLAPTAAEVDVAETSAAVMMADGPAVDDLLVAAPVVDEPVTASVPVPAGPATRVHAERLVSRSPRLHLSPSQALLLATDGPAALRRPRPKAS